MSEKITLVCTSINPNEPLLNKMLDSAKKFDEILIHQDKGQIINLHHYDDEAYDTPTHLSISDAYNLMIKDFVETEWVCCFCDDDYFYSEGLSKMLYEIHKGNARDCEISHFNFHISGHVPLEDKRCWFGCKEYDLGESRHITLNLLAKHNRLPAGSFFRKSAWEKVGGFQGDKFHDWDLWKRMVQAGCKFQYFPHIVYNHVRRPNSAWARQNKS